MSAGEANSFEWKGIMDGGLKMCVCKRWSISIIHLPYHLCRYIL